MGPTLPELNPFSPDVPDSLLAIDADLYYFLRELAQNLRLQHNLTQAGDTTFSWQVMIETSVTPAYALGSLGRFYHPRFGITQARYCKILAGVQSGVPVGLAQDSNSGWVVTDDLSKSSADCVVGVSGWSQAPSQTAYGWVITSGPCVHPVRVTANSVFDSFTKLGWHSDGNLGLPESVNGNLIASFVGEQADLDEIAPNLWEIPAGFCFVESPVPSIKAILDLMMPEFEALQLQVDSITSQVAEITGPQGLPAINLNLTALQIESEKLASKLALESEQRSRVVYFLTERVDRLESSVPATGSPTGNEFQIPLQQLRGEYETFRTSAIETLTAHSNQIAEHGILFGGLPELIQGVQTALVQVNQLAAASMTGPASSTNNGIARWDGVDGQKIKDSVVSIADSGDLNTPGILTSQRSIGGRLELFDGTRKLLVQGPGAGQNAEILVSNSSAALTIGSENAAGVTHIRQGASTLFSFGAASVNRSFLDFRVPDAAYGVGWSGSQVVPTRNAVYNQIESVKTSINAKLTGAAVTAAGVTAATLAGAWVNYGAPYRNAGYYKSADGVVHLEGAIKSGADGTVLTLPAGMRPASTLAFPAYCDSGLCKIEITSGGVVSVTGSSAILTSLSGINFIPS